MGDEYKMVVIKASSEYVKNIMGKETYDKIEEFSKVIGYEYEFGEEVRIEFNPDRPDLFSFVTLADAIKKFYYNKRDETYNFSSGNIDISNENNKSGRPFIYTFIAKGERIGELLNDLIDFHESISDNVGRRRTKAAVGLHDYDTITQPLKYGSTDLKGEFCPYDEDKERKLEEIVLTHEKGKLFIDLAKTGNKVYALEDVNGIISIPPMLNSRRTRVNTSTKNFLVDITATNGETGRKLKLLSMYYFNSLGYELIDDSGILDASPLKQGFESMGMENVNKVSKVIGNEIAQKDIYDYLRKMGYRVKDGTIGIPFYRIDVMGFVDLVEDISKARGYDKISEKEIKLKAFGSANPHKKFSNILSEIMIGMGFQEIMSFFVTNSKNVEFGRQSRELKIMNPKSQDFSQLRNSIFPEMLEFFQRNLRRSYPQRIFEIGRILGEENEEEHMAFAVADSKNGYSYIKGYLETFLKALTQKNYFIDGSNLIKVIINGRGGTILIDDICVGFIGEILPEILINYELANPVTVAEIDVDKLFSAIS